MMCNKQANTQHQFQSEPVGSVVLSPSVWGHDTVGTEPRNVHKDTRISCAFAGTAALNVAAGPMLHNSALLLLATKQKCACAWVKSSGNT
jgi:hypothetical protein